LLNKSTAEFLKALMNSVKLCATAHFVAHFVVYWRINIDSFHVVFIRV